MRNYQRKYGTELQLLLRARTRKFVRVRAGCHSDSHSGAALGMWLKEGGGEVPGFGSTVQWKMLWDILPRQGCPVPLDAI
jgi:hypothetical protein